MASRLGYSMNYRSLGERSYSGKQVMMVFFGLLLACCLIGGGAVIIYDQKLIKDGDTTKTNDLNFMLGATFIILGSLMVLFGLFKMFTKSE